MIWHNNPCVSMMLWLLLLEEMIIEFMAMGEALNKTKNSEIIEKRGQLWKKIKNKVL